MAFTKKVVQRIELVDSQGVSHTFDSEEQANEFIKKELLRAFLSEILKTDGVTILVQDLTRAVEQAVSKLDSLVDEINLLNNKPQQPITPSHQANFNPPINVIDHSLTEPGITNVAAPIPSLHGDGDFTLFSDMPDEDMTPLYTPPPVKQMFRPASAAAKQTFRRGGQSS